MKRFLKAIMWVLGGLVVLSVLASTLDGRAPEPKREATGSASEPTALIDVSSGRPLSEFEGYDSYPYRAALAKNGDAFIAHISVMRAAWDHPRNFTDAISTCVDIANGYVTTEAEKLERVRFRFEGGTTPNVTPRESSALLTAVIKYACPELG